MPMIGVPAGTGAASMILIISCMAGRSEERSANGDLRGRDEPGGKGSARGRVSCMRIGGSCIPFNVHSRPQFSKLAHVKRSCLKTRPGHCSPFASFFSNESFEIQRIGAVPRMRIAFISPLKTWSSEPVVDPVTRGERHLALPGNGLTSA